MRMFSPTGGMERVSELLTSVLLFSGAPKRVLVLVNLRRVKLLFVRAVLGVRGPAPVGVGAPTGDEDPPILKLLILFLRLSIILFFNVIYNFFIYYLSFGAKIFQTLSVCVYQSFAVLNLSYL